MRPLEKLVYSWTWEHDPAVGEQRGDTVVTVEFRDLGKETELVLTHECFATAEARHEHNTGWNECLDRLARLVS